MTVLAFGEINMLIKSFWKGWSYKAIVSKGKTERGRKGRTENKENTEGSSL